MNKKGQSVIENGVTIILILVAIMMVAIMSAATTPLLTGLVAQNNLTTTGMGIVATHINLIMIVVLSLLVVMIGFLISGGNR